MQGLFHIWMILGQAFPGVLEWSMFPADYADLYADYADFDMVESLRRQVIKTLKNNLLPNA